jgi:hypothetical protein
VEVEPVDRVGNGILERPGCSRFQHDVVIHHILFVMRATLEMRRPRSYVVNGVPQSRL